jgi:putative oxidoreductase
MARNFPQSTSSNSGARDTARLLLRLALGILIGLHGIGKLQSGPGMILDLVAKSGLPSALGYLVYVGEIIAPVLLIIGLWTRAAALVIAINMVVAILLVHTGQLLQLSKNGGYALELQTIYLVVALAIALLGAGRFSLGGRDGRWN